MTLKSVTVPRLQDRESLEAWQKARDAHEQHNQILAEYSVPIPIDPNPVPRVLDTRYSPVGLWNMHLGSAVGPKDYSGNGNDLTVETGTARYSRVHPQLGGILFDGVTNLFFNGSPAALQLTGALTILALCLWSDLPTGTNVRTIASHGAAGATADLNYLYRFGVDINNQCQYFSQHGIKVNDVFTNNTFSPRAQLALVGITRSSGGVLNFWYNGETVGASFGTTTMPVNGVNGKFRIGGGSGGAVEFFTGVIASVGLYGSELNSAQMIERNNYTLGTGYGYKTSTVLGENLQPIMYVSEDSELVRASLIPDQTSGQFGTAGFGESLYRIDSSGSLATAQLLATRDGAAASAPAWSPFRPQDMRLVSSPAVVHRGDCIARLNRASTWTGSLDLRFRRIVS